VISRLVLAFVGGCLGGGARLTIGLVWDTGTGIPWQLLVINLVGSFMIGVVAVLWGGRRHLWPLLGPGLLGGFTTFSGIAAMGYVTDSGALVSVAVLIVSMLVCTLAAWAGFALAERRRMRAAA